MIRSAVLGGGARGPGGTRRAVRRNDNTVLRIYKRDGQGPYLDVANEGYKRLRLKEGQIIGVVVYSGREHRREY